MIIGVGLALAVGAPVVLLGLLSIFSRQAPELGVHDGRLTSCPASPNCVSSQADDETHRIEPLTFGGPPDEAMVRLAAVVESLPRMRIVQQSDGYLRVECTSALFRFVDDVEFLMDRGAERIHVRSASRVGHSDLGVNRRRVEEIRGRFDREK